MIARATPAINPAPPTGTTDPLIPAPSAVATPAPARPAVAPVSTGLNFLLLGTDYSGGGNKFWHLLHDAGFTPTRLSPVDDITLLDHGLGVTDLVRASPKAMIAALTSAVPMRWLGG